MLKIVQDFHCQEHTDVSDSRQKELNYDNITERGVINFDKVFLSLKGPSQVWLRLLLLPVFRAGAHPQPAVLSPCDLPHWFGHDKAGTSTWDPVRFPSLQQGREKVVHAHAASFGLALLVIRPHSIVHQGEGDDFLAAEPRCHC